MKIINRYLAFVAIVALLFTSCSKDETNSTSDDPGINSVDLTFGAMLNDLANRAAAVNKNHFDVVPDCSEADPAIAVLQITYDGQAAEDVGDDIVVDILQDGDGYFTDYSEDLKIPVPNNSSVEVILESFKVYDGVVTDSKPYGELIWIAPIESEEGEFDGYVENALPHPFEVSDGTKPYIDVEVLCFDRRMVNEYGYVFFDILPETIYPLCLFVNYCDENGRHFVADYSVDLYFGTDDTGIQLYDHENDASAMATTGDYSEGEYYADPLCLVIPGPPANLDDDEPYLYLIIYPVDWPGTGDIDNTPVPVQLTWEAVEGLLNADGTTNEYLHLLVGECEDALEGDETIGGGNGNGCNGDIDDDGCEDDDDGDGVLDKNDLCPNTPDEVENSEVDSSGCPLDSDNDGVDDYLDECENTPAGTDVDEIGCEADDTLECGDAYFGADIMVTGFKEITANDFEFLLNVYVDGSTITSETSNTIIGTVDLSINNEGDLLVAVNIEAGANYIVTDYTFTASTNDTGSPSVSTLYDDSAGSPGESFQDIVAVSTLDGFNGTNLFLKLEFDVCEKE